MSDVGSKVLVLHGPNINLTGFREPDLYGKKPLDEIDQDIRDYCKVNGVDVRILQSNHEGVLIDTIHEHRRWVEAIVINPGGLTHTSVSLRDALVAIRVPVIEVHLSNVFAREEFRQTSMIAPICVATLSGFGGMGYLLALQALRTMLKEAV